MKIPALPFTTTDWASVPETRHPGETGVDVTDLRDVLGPAYAPHGKTVYIDNTVMDGDTFEEGDELRAEAERLKAGGA